MPTNQPGYLDRLLMGSFVDGGPDYYTGADPSLFVAKRALASLNEQHTVETFPYLLSTYRKLAASIVEDKGEGERTEKTLRDRIRAAMGGPSVEESKKAGAGNLLSGFGAKVAPTFLAIVAGMLLLGVAAFSLTKDKFPALAIAGGKE